MKMDDVEWEACAIDPLHDPELERLVRREIGAVNPAIPYLAHCPWVARYELRFALICHHLAHIPLDLALKVALAVSQINSCRYCFSAMRLLLRMMGVPEREVVRLEQDALAADQDPGERAALRFARRLSRSNPLLSAESLEPVQAAGFSRDAVRELALVAVAVDFENRLNSFAAVPPTRFERMGSGLVNRLVVPLVGRWERRKWGMGSPDHFAADVSAAVPFAFVLTQLDGLPLGRSLWKMLEDAWESALLPRRSKALVFAVVARALGCDASEREAARLVAAEGMTGAELEQVLTHLGSPLLNPLEAQIVPFARETVWYTPAPIQRRLRALQAHLSTPQKLELIGVAGLANMVCRLGVVVNEC